MYVRGAQCVNRAVDGDVVAFELLPEAKWLSRDGMPGEKTEGEVRKANAILFISRSRSPLSISQAARQHYT